jgi:hypothetical protein
VFGTRGSFILGRITAKATGNPSCVVGQNVEPRRIVNGLNIFAKIYKPPWKEKKTY